LRTHREVRNSRTGHERVRLAGISAVRSLSTADRIAERDQRTSVDDQHDRSVASKAFGELLVRVPCESGAAGRADPSEREVASGLGPHMLVHRLSPGNGLIGCARLRPMVGVPGSLGSSLLFLLSMVAVLAWFAWGSQEEHIRASAEVTRKLHLRERTIEQEMRRQRRLIRYVLLPTAAAAVMVAAYCVFLAAWG